jgi:hypothetical protein
MNTITVPFSALSSAEQKRLIKAGIVKAPLDPMFATKRDWFYICLESKTIGRDRVAYLCGVTLTTFNTYMSNDDRRWELMDRFYETTQPRQRDVTLMSNALRNVARKADESRSTNE